MGRWSYIRCSLAVIVLMPALVSAGGPAEGQLTKVKFGTALSPPSLDSITPYVARERGLFREQGLDVEILEFRGDAIVTKALLAGELDVAILGATSGIVSASKGAKIRLWMVPQPVPAFHFVARREAATTLPELVGKTVAVSGIGAISYHIPRIVLERNGVDPEKVRYLTLGVASDRFKALVAGKIDATVVLNTEAAKLADYPQIISLVQVAKAVPEIPYEFCLAKVEYIEKHPEIMYGLTKALIEANRWIVANKTGTVEIAAKVIKDEKPEILAKAYDLGDPRLWGVNGDMTEASYKYTVDFLLRVGYMAEPMPYGRFFDRRFVDRVLGELGRK